MKERRRRSRQQRLITRLVAATVVAGVIAGLIGAWLLQRSAVSAAVADGRDRSRAAADQYAVQVDTRIDNLLGALRLVSTRHEVAGFDPKADLELRVALRVAPSLDELTLYDQSGRATAAAASRFLATPDHYPEAGALVRSVADHEVARLAPGTVPTIELAVAVENPPGHAVGALVARAAIDSITAPLDGAVSRDDPVAFLTDVGGTVLVHPDRARVTPGERFPIDTVLRHADRTAQMNRSGQVQLVAAAKTARLPALVVVALPRSVASAAAERDLRGRIIILVIVMLAAVAAVIAAGEWLLRPLRPLTNAVGRVGRGEHGVRTGVSGYGEIGLLAGEVDRMAEALDRRDEQVAELQDLALLVGGVSERSDVVQQIADGAVKLVRAEAASVYGPIPAPEAESEASAGSASQDAAVGALVADAIAAGQPVRRSSQSTGASAVAVPLVGNDSELLGVLAVQRREDFSDEEVEILWAFASFTAVALDNARRLALQRALATELQEAIDRRRDFIGTITHEFRTPLTCIEGFSSSLLNGWGRYNDHERQDLVGRIAHHSIELDDLVSRFLDFTVTERGGLSAHLEPMALDQAVAKAMQTLAPLLADRQVDVAVPSATVSADPTLL
ncbi:MAG: osmosensitive channel signal transduction histidine kinase, partial [Acidimicrobiia bacterium]|nr:osmosensitive channel signal transduction histidine kinase [Acidimicrobiia bacterium]